MLIRIAILFFAMLAFDAAAADRKEWEQHADCRYIENKYNDGDSFRVSCGAREIILRLYYVDAPESNMSNSARVGEQREYFARGRHDGLVPLVIGHALDPRDVVAYGLTNQLRPVLVGWTAASDQAVNPLERFLVDRNRNSFHIANNH